LPSIASHADKHDKLILLEKKSCKYRLLCVGLISDYFVAFF